MVRRRLEAELVRRGLAVDRDEARAAIDAGRVTVEGSVVINAGSLVAPAQAVDRSTTEMREPFVSRGGRKLDAALERFEVDPVERDALDAGASTGGFTDCLLRRGAARVIAVDVGYGDLAWSLRSDPRVYPLERTNVRDLVPESLPFSPSLVVADLSFISLRSSLPSLVRAGGDRAEFVLLVKPQFEADRDQVQSGGVVRDPGVWASAVSGVAEAGARLGLIPSSVMASPVRGRAGNVEFFLHAVHDDGSARAADIDEAIAEGVRVGKAS